MMLGLELGSIESALATELYPASLYAETRLAPMPCDAPVITTTLLLVTSTRT
jgi:hypothetical protein